MKGTAVFPSRRVLSLLPWAAVWLPGLCVLVSTLLLGVDVPIWDEWALLPFVRAVAERGDWWAHVFDQHNEHRVAALRLPLVAFIRLTGWDLVAQMLFGVVLLGLAQWGAWRVFRDVWGTRPWAFVPVAAVLCCFLQYQVFLFGMMFVWYVLSASVVWALWLLTRRGGAAFWAAMALAVVGSFSIANGLLLWPLGLALLAWRRSSAWRLVSWCAVGSVVVWWYFHGYVKPPHHPSLWLAARHPIDAAGFFLASLGGPLGAGDLAWSQVMGAATVGALGLGVLQSWSRRGALGAGEQVGWVLALYALVSTGMVTLSRLGIGTQFALEGRYATISVWAIVGAVLVLGRAWQEPRRPLLAALLGLLLAGVLAGNLRGWSQAVEWHRLRARQAEALWRLAENRDLWPGISPAPGRLEDDAALLKRLRLTTFRKAPATWSVRRWAEGQPLSPITADATVRQTFRCPVDRLRSIAAVFATYQRSNPGFVEVAVLVAGELVAERRVRSEQILDNGWVSVEIGGSVRCLGREVVVEIRSPNPQPRAVTAWTYPAQLDGALLQGSRLVVGRSLGLELNLRH